MVFKEIAIKHKYWIALVLLFVLIENESFAETGVVVELKEV
jgi:hypothetical protein